MKSKRGISPVIATVLLIVIAIALFAIIYFWIMSMRQETILKFGSDVKQSCLSLDFDVVYSEGEVQIQNKGDITIWRADFFVINGGSSTPDKNGIRGPISRGESSTASITCQQVKVIPILLGTSKGIEKEYKCEDRAKTISCS